MGGPAGAAVRLGLREPLSRGGLGDTAAVQQPRAVLGSRETCPQGHLTGCTLGSLGDFKIDFQTSCERFSFRSLGQRPRNLSLY